MFYFPRRSPVAGPARRLHADIAFLLQEPFLFTGTVYENIRFCTQNAGREEVERAARLVDVRNFPPRWT